MVSPLRSTWTEDDRRIEWEERAAILEYDHGLTREKAEEKATEILGFRPSGVR
jgi:hypothetical protein